MNAAGEHEPLARLGGVHFHKPDAADRFREPACDLGVDRATFAEQWTQALEGECHHPAEGQQHDERRRRQRPVEIKEDREGEGGREKAAEELNETGADEVAYAFGVGHDARDEHARLCRIEVRDGQTKDVRLDALPHLGYRPLRGHAHHLRQREGGDRLHDRGEHGEAGERHQQVGAVFSDDVVDEDLGRPRQDEAGEPVDDHERQADREGDAVLANERASLGPGALFVILGH